MKLAFAARFAWLSIAFVPLMIVACGDDELIGTPPGTGGFAAGSPGGNTGSGTGASYTGTTGEGGQGGEPGPPDCEEEYRYCPEEFTLEGYETASSVEVRGDFAADGWVNGVPMTLASGTWSAELDVPWDTKVLYKYVVDGSTWITDPDNPNTETDGSGNTNSVKSPITCEWWSCETPVLGYDWRDAVLYFVFVDRFLDGNSGNNGTNPGGVEEPARYQGGDWAGVLEKINDDYFTDLGVNTLWLTVPMDNTDASGVGDDGHNYTAYHGYWPSNLDQTESRFGSPTELQSLVEAAHAKDIKIIVDYAMNHVHISSPVYTQHQDWFWPLDFDNKHCVCGEGCAWEGADAKRCWFRDYLPDFNFTNTAARNFSVDNAIQWIEDTGVDGFRLDAVKHIETSWLTDLRSRVSADIETETAQHFYMVGETFTGDRGLINSYVDPATMLDGQFDFPLRGSIIGGLLTRGTALNAPFDQGGLDAFIRNNISYYGTGVMSTFIGNHDVPRVVHFAQDTPISYDTWYNGKDRAWNNEPSLPSGTSAFERLANAYTVLFTLPGVPLIYYGDEVGMPGAGDPDNRRFMQWSGYSTGQTFLRNRITALASIRAAHPALRRGSYTSLAVTADTMAYRMQESGDTVYVLINRGDGAANVSGVPSGSYTDEISGDTISGGDVSVPARSARILVAQ